MESSIKNEEETTNLFKKLSTLNKWVNFVVNNSIPEYARGKATSKINFYMIQFEMDFRNIFANTDLRM